MPLVVIVLLVGPLNQTVPIFSETGREIIAHMGYLYSTPSILNWFVASRSQRLRFILAVSVKKILMPDGEMKEKLHSEILLLF